MDAARKVQGQRSNFYPLIIISEHKWLVFAFSSGGRSVDRGGDDGAREKVEC